VDDPFELQRFVDAQNPVYGQVCAEMRAGRKRSHWIWFVFPQIAGLGASAMAQRYAISSLAEADAYLLHPMLGARLVECTQFVLAADAGSAEEIFGGIDAMKFRSSMTLFARAAPDNPVFRQALEKYFGGRPDPLTLERL
jgi:uncharacterized protein (DUF1810 family)